MAALKWEYKIVDLSNSTSMGYNNPETEEFKEKHKGDDWKLIMMNIEINKLGQDGWEMVSNNDQLIYMHFMRLSNINHKLWTHTNMNLHMNAYMTC